MTVKKSVSAEEAQKIASPESQIWRWNKEYKKVGNLWRLHRQRPLKMPKNGRIIELGCGNGKTLSDLICENCELYAVDFSEEAVYLCKEFAEKRDIPVKILVADVRQLPFKDSFFDVVVCAHVLEHLLEADRKKAVSEIRRVLRPGGLVFTRVFSITDMRCGKGIIVENFSFLHGNRIFYHYFSENELEMLFSASRMKKKKLEKETWRVRYGKKFFTREVFNAVFEKSATK